MLEMDKFKIQDLRFKIIRIFNFQSLIKDKGFTLMEILLVIAIISMLAAMIFPALSNVKIRARTAKAVSELKTIEVALMEYYAGHSGFPTNKNMSPPTTNGLDKLVEEDYLDTTLKDAFRSPQTYIYYDCTNGTDDTADSCIVFSVGFEDDVAISSFEEAINDAYPAGKTEPNSDNIYLLIDPRGLEGDIRYKK